MNESVVKALPMISGVMSLIVAAATAGYVVGSLDGRVGRLETGMVEINDKIKQHEENQNSAFDSMSTKMMDLEKITKNQLRAGNLPSGTILAMFSWPGTLPHGWVTCGDKETPNLNGRFLFGTTDKSKLEAEVGSMPHKHFANLKTTGEKRGRHQRGERGTESDYADNISQGVEKTGVRNWYHEHDVNLAISPENSEDYLPPATQVLFLCKPGSTKPVG